MRAIKKPELDVEEVYFCCVSSIGSSDLRSRLSDIDKVIIEAAKDYDLKSQNSSLYVIPGNDCKDDDLVVGNVNKNELKNLYTQQMAVLNKPARRTYDLLISAAPKGKCPFCGFGHATTLDHYLPKAKFPYFSVLPYNLVPACKDCNTGKKAKLASTAEAQVLHPYYDHQSFISEQWLFAEVIETSPAAVKFFVKPPAHWDSISKQRVKTHFVGFKLEQRFSVEAAEELSTLKSLLGSFLKNSGKESIREHLKERFLSEYDVHKNSWKTAMYLGLSASDWYCEDGFNSD